MHYTGTIWRPPYEASSFLLEVTAGCTHHSCKFCTLYEDLPFKFKMSPLEDIEADLKEAGAQLSQWSNLRVLRTFLVGANPFVLKAARLLKIADLIKKYFPSCQTIGCFSRVTDIALKTDDELVKLHRAGYDSLTIGIETGDDEALEFMNKGYRSKDILTQCRRLDQAGIRYNFFYLTGISGMGKGNQGAKATAAVCNRLHPEIIGASMLTVYPSSELYKEIQKGNWQEETEIEKYKELKVLIEHLKVPLWFGALGASNPIPIQGTLPKEKENLLAALDEIIETVSEEELHHYRKNLRHL
ncbi:radical SAM protein [Candidatus Merdisoma sp. JLR.KK006]|uniref:radical SAM protein n=1 Tax=Candidatus Merdisoma sp. JLR.KK006 TaxID=3112626 RepID=UPI002FF39676